MEETLEFAPADNGCYTSLKSFEIERKIGKGQFGNVYQATCKGNGKAVAIKSVLLTQIPDEKSREDCIKEINLLQQLNHSNIIKYLGSFIEMNELHIVMELADGGDLLGLINYAKKNRFLIAENFIWKYFAQITDALQHMHDRRIMHRDIKPANVFLTKNRTIKLGDLGLGRFFGIGTFAVNSLVGTPYYMSPERINEYPYDFKSDIWSLGCLLYELAALQSPFYGDKMNFYTLCKRIQLSEYAPIPCSRYSKQIHELVAACLRCEPVRRPDIRYLNETAKKMDLLFNTCTN